MKKTFIYLLLAALTTLSSCYKDDIDDIKSRLDNLEAWQESVNSNISSLQSLVQALENNDYVKSVTALSDGSGYVLNFVKSGAVTIKNGEKGADGEDGATPIISVKQDTDGKYYWIVNGEWLLNSDGNKVATAGKDGEDGKDGVDGTDGKDGVNGSNGTNGITPRVQINDNGEWEVSMDNGVSFVSTGVKAQGDAIFAEDGIDYSNANYVTLTLADGTTKITLQRYLAFKIGLDESNNAYYVANSATIQLRMPEGFKESDYTAIMAQITSNQGTNTNIKTRTATERWNVEVIKPTFTNGIYDNNAAVKVTMPVDAEFGEVAILEVTLICNDGSKLVAIRTVKSTIPFGDANFRKAVIKTFITNNTPLKAVDNTTNLTESAASIPLTQNNKDILANFTGKLEVYEQSIESLSGIEYLTGLTLLNCCSNQLTSLDVSKNTKLEGLNCGLNQLTSLDVSKNTKLEGLNCLENKLTSLDVSKNTKLEGLDCGLNQLTSLDVSKNTALTQLYCGANQLTSLDVSKNTVLKELSCVANQLTSLDVSKNTVLKELSCDGNPLTSLDVSKNTALTVLSCGYNFLLTSLDVSKNTALTVLRCDAVKLTSLDISQNTVLKKLSCTYNNLTSLDVSKNTQLTDLFCSNNQLSALDVSENTVLDYLDCSDNKLTSVDVSKNTVLRELNCDGNQLSTLDVSKNTALTRLHCYKNHLSTLDISNTMNTISWQVGNQTTVSGTNQTLMFLLKQSQKNGGDGYSYNDNITLSFTD